MFDFPKQKIPIGILYSILLSFLAINLTSRILQTHLEFGTNSDLLYPFAFWEDIFLSEEMDWNLPPAPCFFPDILIYGFFFSITKNGIFSYYLYSISFVLLLFWSFKKLFLELSIQDFIDDEHNEILVIHKPEIAFHLSFCSIASLLILFCFLPSDFALFFTIGYHGGFWVGLFFPFLFLKEHFFKQDYSYWIFIIFILLLIPSDSHFVIQILIPGFLIIGFFLIINKKMLKISKIGIVAILFGFLCKNLLHNIPYWKTPQVPVFQVIKKDILNGKIFLNIKNGIFHFQEKNFGFYDHFLLLGIWCIFLIFAIYFFIRIQKEKKELFFFSFLSFSISIPLLLQFLLGVWMAPRYNWGLYIFPFFFFPYLLYRYSNKYFFYYIGLFTYISVFAIFFTYIGFYKSFPENERSNCIRDFANQKKIHYGISDYWNAKYMTLYTKHELVLSSHTENLEKYYWIDNKKHFTHSEYNLILLDGLDVETVIKKWGEPNEKIQCKKSILFFYQ